MRKRKRRRKDGKMKKEDEQEWKREAGKGKGKEEGGDEREEMGRAGVSILSGKRRRMKEQM